MKSSVLPTKSSSECSRYMRAIATLQSANRPLAYAKRDLFLDRQRRVNGGAELEAPDALGTVLDERAIPLFTLTYGFGFNAQRRLPHANVLGDVLYDAMEAIFTPGMTAPAHRHSGPEAWYTLTGETCLETPDGKMIGRAGGAHVIVPGGPPMHLTATGTETRRALVVIVHHALQPPTTPAHDWTPRGLCKQ